MSEHRDPMARTFSPTTRGSYALLAALVLAVLTAGTSAGAGATAEDVDGQQTNTDTVTAPSWPFVGIVAVQSDMNSDESTIFLYWDSETGVVSEVSLDQRSWHTYCPSQLSANRHRVRYSLDSFGTVLEFIIPWGDRAYPVLHSERFVDFYTRVDDGSAIEDDDGQLDIGMQYGVLRVKNSEDVAYYRITGERPPGETRLERIDSQRGAQAFEAEKDEDERFWGSIGWELGSAGFHYGFNERHSEPACQTESAYIVDGRTGELVWCFHSWGGPAPIFVGKSWLQTLELPQRSSSAVCDGFGSDTLTPGTAPDGVAD